MSLLAVQGGATGTGTVTILAPVTNTNRTLTLPDVTDTVAGIAATQTLTNKTLSTGLVMGASAITSGTAVASTSGTSIDFTGIPSWVKRITVMFNGVSLSGTSIILIQLGTTSSVEITGYVGQIIYVNSGSPGNQPFSSGIQLYGTGASAAILNSGAVVFTNVSGNIWVFQGAVASEASSANNFVAGRKTTAVALDRIRITTVNGTDTFDAGSINIMYE